MALATTMNGAIVSIMKDHLSDQWASSTQRKEEKVLMSLHKAPMAKRAEKILFIDKELCKSCKKQWFKIVFKTKL
jgi:hypothetical protein